MFQIDFAVFFYIQSAPHAFFFAGIEPFESDLPLSTVSACLSVRPHISNFSVNNDNSTPIYTISLGNIVIRARL